MDYINGWKNRSRQDVKDIKDKLLSNTRNVSLEKLDEMAGDADRMARKAIDCMECANCCKTTVTSFNDEDIRRISSRMGMSTKSFKNQYLMHDMEEWVTRTTPCPFLQADNACSIYEFRPDACRSFPHTQRKGFMKRRRAHMANLEVCPITYFVVESMVKKL